MNTARNMEHSVRIELTSNANHYISQDTRNSLILEIDHESLNEFCFDCDTQLAAESTQ